MGTFGYFAIAMISAILCGFGVTTLPTNYTKYAYRGMWLFLGTAFIIGLTGVN